MLEDAEARLLFLDAGGRRADRRRAPQRAAHRARRLGAPAAPFEAWLAPAGARPAPVDARSPTGPSTSSIPRAPPATPKGIVQPHGMRWAHVRRGAKYGYGPDTVTLLSTPLYSNTTLVVFFPTLACGGTRGADAQVRRRRATWQLAEQHRVTHTMLVPVQYQRLMALPGLRPLRPVVASASSSAPARRSRPRSRPTCWRAGRAGWSSSTA